MKKSFCLSLAVLACCLALSACRKNDDPDMRGRYNTVIADYLYGVEYDDYSFIKINHTDSHFASIGMVGCFPQFNNDVARTGEYNEVYKYLPFKTEDGVNEHGARYTNPTASLTCCVNYLPRILLDRARNVTEAKEIVRSINWTDPRDYPHKGESQSFHWLICDADSSCVLEFMDNVPVFTESSDINSPSFATVMTNFSNCLWKTGVLQNNGIGYERWDKLSKNYYLYEFNFEGMQNLMRGVWYSKSYTEPVGSPYYWMTELSTDAYPAQKLYKNPELMNNPTFRKLVETRRDQFADKSCWYTDDCELWFTTHTSVYDLDSKTLHVLVHEGYSGMKDFYEAGLDSHFKKPLR